MWLFPVGELNEASTSSTGYMDGVAYSFFEPNQGVSGGAATFNVNTLKMKDQLIQTFKQAEPIRKFTYKYENIFHREFLQLDAFTYSVGGSLTAFHLANLSMGELYIGTITTVATIPLSAARMYTTILNSKANYAFIWNGIDFMVGLVTAYSATTISIARFAGANSVTNPIVCPIYEVFMSEEAMGNFETNVFNSDPGTDGGWIWSGDMSFITKFTV